MHVTRLHRVLKLLTLLETGRPYNAAQLAEACGVSRRTIYRDLNTLEAAGIPVFFDQSSGRYQVHETGLMPAVNLRLEEALALVLLAGELGRKGGVPLLEPARDAAAKIEASLPLGMRAVIERLARTTVVRTPPTARHRGLHATYRLVQDAVRKRRPLEAVYISFHDEGQIRTRLEPYWLLFSDRAWYVVGRSSRHKEVRTFKLGRFKKLEVADGRFTRPKGLTLEKHLGNAWRLMRGDTSYDVHLKFSPLVSPNVAEVTWHRTQQVAWDEDGCVHFRATVDGLAEIVWWILGYGDQVEVVAPPALRRRVGEVARRMLAMYEGASR
jgi:proteasome accessory factor B